MSENINLSLYRKYRPQKFEEVCGQDGMVDVLKQAIKNNEISHAYLFSGCRGVGKTSMARIFAKEIGCNSTDLVEIDAASHTSIEDIKKLAENVYTAPMYSPYTVYILDEVHMLSISAFNAFLKTLEEPPSHCIFLLATTEEQPISFAKMRAILVFPTPDTQKTNKRVISHYFLWLVLIHQPSHLVRTLLQIFVACIFYIKINLYFHSYIHYTPTPNRDCFLKKSLCFFLYLLSLLNSLIEL